MVSVCLLSHGKLSPKHGTWKSAMFVTTVSGVL